MEFVVGKTVHLSLMGFIIGAGIEGLRLADAYVQRGTRPLGPAHLLAAAAAREAAVAEAAARAATAVVSASSGAPGGVVPPIAAAAGVPPGPLLANRPPPAAAAAASAASTSATSAVAPPSALSRLARSSYAYWLGPAPSPFVQPIAAAARLAARPLWQQAVVLSARDGFLTARVLATGTFVMGTLGFLRHGRDVDAIFDYQRDELPLAAGITSAGLLVIPAATRAARVATAVGGGAASYWLAARRNRAAQQQQ